MGWHWGLGALRWRRRGRAGCAPEPLARPSRTVDPARPRPLLRSTDKRRRVVPSRYHGPRLGTVRGRDGAAPTVAQAPARRRASRGGRGRAKEGRAGRGRRRVSPGRVRGYLLQERSLQRPDVLLRRGERGPPAPLSTGRPLPPPTFRPGVLPGLMGAGTDCPSLAAGDSQVLHTNRGRPPCPLPASVPPAGFRPCPEPVRARTRDAGRGLHEYPNQSGQSCQAVVPDAARVQGTRAPAGGRHRRPTPG